MYFVWQQRLFDNIESLNGQSLEVIHPGLRNLETGPDFFNAKVRYDGILWAGNVEMHVRASDWYRHHHQDNKIYDSVILHVVLQADEQIYLHDGTELKTVVMHIPNEVMKRYFALCGTNITGKADMPLLPGQTPSYTSISCRPRITELPKIILHDWMNALVIQRMLGKMSRVQNTVEQDMKSWEEGFYIILMRSLGTGTNGDAMERLARSLPYSHLLHHRDNLFQLRAMLLGQASLIDPSSPESAALHSEYHFLRNKFNLTPLPSTVWKMSRLRPLAAPDHRIESFATLIWTHKNLLSEILECHTLDQIEHLLSVKGIGRQTQRILIINAVIPTLLSYYKWQGEEERCEEVLSLLEKLPAEDNRYMTQWIEAGIPIRSAFDSQALLHLYQNYCQPHKCLQCRIGCWLIKHQDTI